MKTKFSIVSFFSIIFFAFFLIGCGSSDSGGSGDSGDPDPLPGGDPVMITGMAAAGLPIVGIVNVKGAAGNTASANIEIDGSYELDVSALTAPYVLFASGMVGDKGVELYSTGVGAGAINITPITNLITKEVMGDLDNLFDDWASESTVVNTAAIEAAETKIHEQITPILVAYGISGDIDLMSVDFDTDHSGLDAVLDVLEITIDASNDVTITNTTTETSVTGDEPFDETETDAIAVIISETAQINIIWSTITTTFATTPTIEDMSNDIAPLISDEFLSNGDNKDKELSCVVRGDCFPVGIQLSSMIYKPMDSSADNLIENYGNYDKGYWIKVFYEFGGQSGFFITSVVYNGINWLHYGNRNWVDLWFKFAATKRVSVDGTTTYTSDIFHSIDGNSNYAYNQGICYALIRGPGLPYSNGDGYNYQVMEENFPDTDFSNDGSRILSDASADAVPENSEYIVWLFETNDFSGTIPLKEQRVTIPSKPYLPSEVTESLFPTLTFPTTNDISSLNIGGDVTLTWINHADCEVNETRLTLCDGGPWNGTCLDLEPNNPDLSGASYTFDTSTDMTPNWARVDIECTDQFGRIRGIDWYLD